MDRYRGRRKKCTPFREHRCWDWTSPMSPGTERKPAELNVEQSGARSGDSRAGPIASEEETLSWHWRERWRVSVPDRVGGACQQEAWDRRGSCFGEISLVEMWGWMSVRTKIEAGRSRCRGPSSTPSDSLFQLYPTAPLAFLPGSLPFLPPLSQCIPDTWLYSRNF